MYMMLTLAKGIVSYDKAVRSGDFKKNVSSIETYELFKKEILIAGFGRIGKNLIKRCLGFEMKVKVFDPFVEKKIKVLLKRQMEKTQNEYYLNEQMKAIQKELGESEDVDEISEIEKKIEEYSLSKEAKDKCKSEIKKLKSMSPMSAEATVIRNYLDWVLSIPWNQPNQISKNIKKASDILENDHYGLIKVKERILEYLAVQKRMDKIKGPI